MHFIDQIDFVTTFGWRVPNVLPQLAHIFDAVIARAIDLDDVQAVASRDLLAIIAHAARRDRRPLQAVERLCQNARGGCFADATWANKQIRMSKPVLRHRILQRARNVRLADQIIECLRPIFSGENLVTHAVNLNGKVDSRKLSELVVDS